jgi:hypothetical protein
MLRRLMQSQKQSPAHPLSLKLLRQQLCRQPQRRQS